MLLNRLIPTKLRVKAQYDKKLGALKDYEALKKNMQEKGRYAGKRCFIVGNGPSVKCEDLSLLKDEIVFTVNDMYLYEQFPSLNTNYHLLFDPLHFEDMDEVIQKVNAGSSAAPTIVTSLEGKAKLADKTLPNAVLCLQSGLDIDHLKYVGLDIAGLLPYYCTVIQYALSLAIEMGFAQIYLLGCDCTGIQNFIERKKGELPTSYCFEMTKEDEQRVANATMMRSEHAFFEWYHIFKSYRILNEVAKSRNIEIVDLTADGILDIYPKAKLKDIVQVK